MQSLNLKDLTEIEKLVIYHTKIKQQPIELVSFFLKLPKEDVIKIRETAIKKIDMDVLNDIMEDISRRNNARGA